jgi:hypothetical protein
VSRLPDFFHEDKALRDAARDVVLADIDHARRLLSRQGLATRVTGRIGDGAKDVFEVAKGHALDKRAIIAGLIALLALWFARQPLMEIFGLVAAPVEGDADGQSEATHEVETNAQVGDDAETDEGGTPDD